MLTALRGGTGGFYVGLFMVAASTTALQIVQTRILSVISWYSLAFLAISMAMLGLTAGSLLVYFYDRWLSQRPVAHRLAQGTLLLAIAIAVSWLFLINSIAISEIWIGPTLVLIWLHMIIVLALPYVLAGAVIALALTRTPLPIGTVYGVDLAGAAAGCLLVLAMMAVLDGVSAMLALAALSAFSASAFMMSAQALGGDVAAHADHAARLSRSARRWGLWLIVACSLNAALYPFAGRLLMDKTRLLQVEMIETLEWNAFSRIEVSRPLFRVPSLNGRAPNMPGEMKVAIEERVLAIDGGASTQLYAFDGDREDLAFLEYDITNLAYAIRNGGGSAAVIGVGGGRDMMSAHYFGFEAITGIELNPIIVENLTERYADFNRISAVPGVEIHVDDARAWFASNDGAFDLMQMSLIDTWAATGAGAHSLAENGLYTMEAWQTFLNDVTPNGVFTVSRWFNPDSVGETGRMVSLTMATLYAMGAERPADHIYLASVDQLATIVVSRAPLSAEEIGKLDATVERMGFQMLMRPGSTPSNPVLAAIAAAPDTATLYSLAEDAPLDFSPTTDDQPFFFNQLKLTSVGDWGTIISQQGVASGNIIATLMLAVIVAVSGLAVVATMIVPTLPTLKRTDGRLAGLGTGYFLLIGLGFMFAEIALMQRLSIFLGHPVYGLAIALAGIILSTGIGAAISERRPLVTPRHLTIWVGGTVLFIASLPVWLPTLLIAASSQGIVIRAIVCLLAVAPAGLMLGFAFPTGMRLVRAIDDSPTPWFWAVNGAAGVLASGLAVAVGTFVSISASFAIAAVCYALLLPVALGLHAHGQRKASDYGPVGQASEAPG
ncbi:MAG: hypothetical protein AAF899_11590 [Pseudomonadota bacterium]